MSGRIAVLLAAVLFFCGCKKDPQAAGKLTLNFALEVDGVPLVFNALQYQNDAGNRYEVSEVKFFISEVRLYQNGEAVAISDNRGIHYFDSNLPGTAAWHISEELPAASYDSIAFVFGLPPEKNVTGFFVNPPENNMSWPDYLGGGYHYMQINGRWLAENDVETPFCLHTGIGQCYENEQVTEFVHNHFSVVLPLSGFQLKCDNTSSLTLVMNVNNWFRAPHRIDWNAVGGHIMQNQEAQQMFRENGARVFEAR